MVQYNLKVARTEGADASSRADNATASLAKLRKQFDEAQAAAQEAATTAAAEISTLQVIGSQCKQVCNPHMFLSISLSTLMNARNMLAESCNLSTWPDYSCCWMLHTVA